MPAVPLHLNWLVKDSKKILSADGVSIELWELRYQPHPQVLSAWAKHFRNHYCVDHEIDVLRAGTSLSRADYLTRLKFPDAKTAPGPSIRSGDFAEILVADYVEYVLKFWVPRCRYDRKTIRNESGKGSDILGFKFVYSDKTSPRDILLIFESKAQLAGKKAKAILQEAIEHSAKDELRKAESLNAAKQRLLDRNATGDAEKISRFQSPEDSPYKTLFGAAAMFSSDLLDLKILQKSDATSHPHKKNLSLVVISRTKLMELTHNLYEVAANEA
jgi:uncharacterized protein DUF1837